MTPREQLLGIFPILHGWCPQDKALALMELVEKTKPKLVVEVGTWGGKSLFPMALAVRAIGAGRVISIDPWSAKASAAGQTDPDSEKWWNDQDHEKVYQSFLYHMRKLGVESVIQVIRECSNNVEPPADVDILHLDGNHGPEALEDAQRFAPKVKLGGYCILDDLDWAGGYVRLAEKFILGIGFQRQRNIGTGAIYQRIEMGAPKIATEAVDPRSPLPTLEESLDSQLTVAFITSREKPNLDWFIHSLINTGLRPFQILVVDLWSDRRNPLGPAAMTECTREAKATDPEAFIKIAPPKPTIWQGKYRLTKEDWWAASNARNTAICLCRTEWLACVDDRCVVMPGWAEAVRDAMRGNYVVCGSYQKRVGMSVEGGFIKHGGTIVGEDTRFIQRPNGVDLCPGEWTFGCNLAFPIAWALEVNGWDELFDSLGFEDCFFGKMLWNCGHPIRFDARMRVIQDRTPEELGTPMKRTDKGVSPNDKSHAAVRKFSDLKRTLHPWDLAAIRQAVLAGGGWPDVSVFPRTDWYNGEPWPEL